MHCQILGVKYTENGNATSRCHFEHYFGFPLHNRIWGVTVDEIIPVHKYWLHGKWTKPNDYMLTFFQLGVHNGDAIHYTKMKWEYRHI